MSGKKTYILMALIAVAILVVAGVLIPGRSGSIPAQSTTLAGQANAAASGFIAKEPAQTGSAELQRRAEAVLDHDIQPAAEAAPERVAYQAPEVLVPVAFVDPDPSERMDPSELNAWRDLRRQFIEELNAGPKLEPDSAEYLARWKRLQAEFDENFRAQFGSDDLLKYQQAAASMQPR